jgi:hypothetical protein
MEPVDHGWFRLREYNAGLPNDCIIRGAGTALEQNQSRCTLPHVRKNKDEIQGSFPFAALEGQDDDFKK